MRRFFFIGCIGVIALLAATPGRGDDGAVPTRPVFGQLVSAKVKAIFTRLQADHDYGRAAKEANELFDVVAIHAPDTDAYAFVDAAYAVRLSHHFEFMPAEQCDDLLPYLRRFDELAKTLAFLVSDSDKPVGVYGVLKRLIDACGDKPGVWPTLTAALCVVHDSPMERKINENTAVADDPVKLFDFYSANESRMLFGIRVVPAELLIYVVDSTAKIDEMKWALAAYRGDTAVGKHFFDVPYDYEHLRTHRPKRISSAGFTLMNIRQFGGICADQAYFASTIGKAIGVPTAYVSGQSGEVSHAWVGFLQRKGVRDAGWNFDIGRYEAYQGIRGVISDPQTREPIPDGYLAVQAELLGTKTTDRRIAVALVDAAVRLGAMPKHRKLDVAKVLGIDGPLDLPEPRSEAIEGRLELIDAALRHNPGNARAWFVVRDLATTGRMTLAQKHHWALTLQRLTAHQYPDFTLTILKPMIASIDDPDEQDRIWNAAIKLLQDRKDLVAEVRMAQGELWEKQKNYARAKSCYDEVIDQFANAGPFVIGALEKAEALLRTTNNPDAILPLYQQTWLRLDKPSDMAGEFSRQSNWYRVGLMYVKKLNEAGQTQQAGEVQSQLKQVVGG